MNISSWPHTCKVTRLLQGVAASKPTSTPTPLYEQLACLVEAAHPKVHGISSLWYSRAQCVLSWPMADTACDPLKLGDKIEWMGQTYWLNRLMPDPQSGTWVGWIGAAK